jgi:GNAT superfamily N-acetyltransferase
MDIEVRRLGPGDEEAVHAARGLFDAAPQPEATQRFLAEPANHLLVAYDADTPVGFVSGVELTHPDKGTEMFLYELGVDEPARGRGVGRTLVQALAAAAREAGCYDMWVLADADNAAALATYARAGGRESSLPVLWSGSSGVSGLPLARVAFRGAYCCIEGGREAAAVRGARRRPQSCAPWACDRACFVTPSGAASVERRSYPLQTWEDRRSTAGAAAPLLPSPRCGRKRGAVPLTLAEDRGSPRAGASRRQPGSRATTSRRARRRGRPGRAGPSPA